MTTCVNLANSTTFVFCHTWHCQLCSFLESCVNAGTDLFYVLLFNMATNLPLLFVVTIDELFLLITQTKGYGLILLFIDCNKLAFLASLVDPMTYVSFLSLVDPMTYVSFLSLVDPMTLVIFRNCHCNKCAFLESCRPNDICIFLESCRPNDICIVLESCRSNDIGDLS